MSDLRKIYTKAAQMIAEEKESYTCIAIKRQCPGYGNNEGPYPRPGIKKYLHPMEDRDLQFEIMDATPEGSSPGLGPRRDLRVMLLLMAAEVLG